MYRWIERKGPVKKNNAETVSKERVKIYDLVKISLNASSPLSAA